MKKLMLMFLAGCLAFLSSATPANEAKSAASLLQEGRYAEDIDGNLDKAIGIYEQIIKDTSADGTIKAQAMFQQGLCYIKKGDEGKAQDVLGRLVAQYPQQTKLVEKAQVTLLELTDSDPAALMPPETIAYIEVGSPGKQVETILNMLKGTPFENPLAAIGQGNAQPGQQSPAQIFNALLNPSMMTEFKKIRGMAVGVIEIKNNPSIVAVLYPGKSDAFRGLVMAGLGMAGQPAEAIEGMSILNIQNQAGVASDDNVIIIAQPMELLKKAINLYKRKSGGPNLAENNKAFAEIGKAVRKQNALTVWAKVDKVFDAIKKEAGENSKEMKLAEAFLDPQNIDEFVATVSINNESINYDEKTSFKAGHQGLAYNLFRTANLSKEGFANVPSEAVALVSIALGPNTGEKIQKPLENITGLDLGREIFDNIEQINIYAVPAAFTSGKAQSPLSLVECVGIAITSKNPVQTQQVLKRILGTVDTIAQLSSGQNEKGQAALPSTDKYMLPVGDGQKLYCYLGQNEKTTILTFSPSLLKSSLAAKGKSVLASGPLQGSVSQLGPNTSKLVLLNAGGLIKIAEGFFKVKRDNPDNPGYKTLEQIAAIFDKTNIQIRTNERDDSLAVHASLEHIPPMKDVFPLVMQMRNMNLERKTVATNPQPADGSAIKAVPSITLRWRPGAAAVSHKVYVGSGLNKLTLLAETKENNCELKSPEQAEGAGYYWRVDEVWADGTVITGDVWSFTASGKLVGWWKLDETEGSIAADSSGGNHTGTLMGNPRWQPTGGKVGGALEFNGVDDYVDTDYTTDLPVWTVAVWVKSPAEPTSEIQNGPVHREKNYQINWSHVFDDFRGAAGVSVGGNWYAAGFGELRANTWYHLAATYDGENLKAYKDGVLITDNPQPSGPPDAESEVLKIGKHAVDIHHFAGTIDDVRIYNYALSGKEIADIYRGSTSTTVKETAKTVKEIAKTTGTAQPDIKGLVGWWKLDGNADDSSGSGSNGTVVNGPQWVAGRIGGALKFDGEDDYVSLPIGQLISTLNRSTIAVWVDFSNTGGAWQRIFDFGDDTTNYVYLSPRTDTSGPMRVAITAGEGQWTDLDASSGALAGGWHHVAVVLEPDNLRLYLDGKNVGGASSMYALSDLGATTNNWLGRSQYSSDAYFSGSMDDFRIYNRSLSDKEIADIYQSGLN